MNSYQLLQVAENKNIPVYDFKTRNKKAFCLEDAIAIDFSRVETEREQKRLLSEELGHILSGALYPLSYCGNPLYRENIQKQERRAHDRSLRLQIPLCELRDAISRSVNDYEVAELLDVDIFTLSDAMEFYKRKGLL